MAVRVESLNTALPETRASAAIRLAALPTGTIVAVFDSRVDAVGTAVQLTAEHPDGSIWIATGDHAVLKIRAARAARSLFRRLTSGLSNDEIFVRAILAQAEREKTVLVVQPHDSAATLARLAGARHVIEFGRWTTRPIR